MLRITLNKLGGLGKLGRVGRLNHGPARRRPLGRAVEHTLQALSLLLLLLCATACEEPNELVVDVGTAALRVVDPDLVSQGIPNAELRVQVAQWTLTRADLILAGDPVPHDMKFNKVCSFTDTAFSPSVTRDKCGAGIVLGVGDGTPVEATLNLVFTMTMRRGSPKQLTPTLDEDGDGIANARDLCPYVFDDNDLYAGLDGIGDACTDDNGLSDTDGDGSPDGTDNCLWHTNPGQEDTLGPGADGIPDAIGDACLDHEQVADVLDSATRDREIEVTLPAGQITDLASRIAFLIVDFRSRTSVVCDWSAGECLLDTSKIAACVTSGTTICR